MTHVVKIDILTGQEEIGNLHSIEDYFYCIFLEQPCIFSNPVQLIITGWERTVHVSRCPALCSGSIFVPLCRELIIFVFWNNQMWEF